MFEKEDNHLRTHHYLKLSTVIILLFILMFFTVNLVYFMRKSNDESYNQDNPSLKQNMGTTDIMERDTGEDYFFTLVASNETMVESGLRGAKIPYSLVHTPKDIKEGEGNLIIDSKFLSDPEDFKVIEKFIKDKKNIIFLNMPKVEDIKRYKLEELLGIGYIRGKKVQKELNLVPGFMLGGYHEFTNISYDSYQLDLSFTSKVYGFGKDHAPIIWRNTYEESQIYVINGPFMDTNAAYGILTALMGEMYENYIYPVINARLITYEGLPYVSYENNEKLEAIYNRDAMKVQHDILLPEILTINRRREFIPNGYLRVGFKQEDKAKPDQYSINQVNSTKELLYKEGGQVGLWYSGDLDYDKQMYKTIFPDDDIESILVRQKPDQIEHLLQVSDALQSIIGPWESESAFDYLDKDTVYIPFTVDGSVNKGQDRLEFISAVTAFASMVQNLSLEDVILLKGNKENWKLMSRSYVKFIDTYRERFDFLEDKDITGMANEVKIFRNSTPKIKVDPSKISFKFDQWYGKSDYILRTDKQIDGIRNGKIKEIEKGAYLITATNKNVEIAISEHGNKTQGR